MGLMGMARQVFLQLGLAVVEQLELVWLLGLVIMEEQLMLGELLVVPKEQAMVLARQVQLGLVVQQVELLAKQLVLVEVMLEREELLFLEQELGELMVLEVSLVLVDPLEHHQVMGYHRPYLEHLLF